MRNCFCKCVQPKISTRTHFLTDIEDESDIKIVYKSCKRCPTRYLKYTYTNKLFQPQIKEFRGEKARERYNFYKPFIIQGKKESKQYKKDYMPGFTYADGKDYEINETNCFCEKHPEGLTEIEMKTPIRKLSNSHKAGVHESSLLQEIRVNEIRPEKELIKIA